MTFCRISSMNVNSLKSVLSPSSHAKLNTELSSLRSTISRVRLETDSSSRSRASPTRSSWTRISSQVSPQSPRCYRH